MDDSLNDIEDLFENSQNTSKRTKIPRAIKLQQKKMKEISAKDCEGNVCSSENCSCQESHKHNSHSIDQTHTSSVDDEIDKENFVFPRRQKKGDRENTNHQNEGLTLLTESQVPGTQKVYLKVYAYSLQLTLQDIWVLS